MKFVVAAPHSFCDQNRSARHCDRSAALAVRELTEYDAGRHIRHVQVSDKLRLSNYDYNRPNTDSTLWREGLRAQIKSIAPDFVFEIHSFPGNHAMYQCLWPKADLCIFESPHNGHWVSWLASEIRRRVPSEFVILVVKPWHPVAITDDVIAIRQTTPECGRIHHSLFEFNEDMPQERVPALARAIYDSVSTLISSGSSKFSQLGIATTVLGGNPGIDTSVTHPASLKNQKNNRELVGLTIVFLILSLILIGVGRALYDRTSGLDDLISERISRAFSHVRANPS